MALAGAAPALLGPGARPLLSEASHAAESRATPLRPSQPVPSRASCVSCASSVHAAATTPATHPNVSLHSFHQTYPSCPIELKHVRPLFRGPSNKTLR